MAIRVTRWYLDTCSCILEYEWDDSLSEDRRTHTLTRLVRPCSAHMHLEAASVYGQVVDENTRKNRVFERAKALLPTLEVEDYGWSFDAQRVLQVKLPTLPAPLKAALQSECDSLLGVGKTKVV